LPARGKVREIWVDRWCVSKWTGEKTWASALSEKKASWRPVSIKVGREKGLKAPTRRRFL